MACVDCLPARPSNDDSTYEPPIMPILPSLQGWRAIQFRVSSPSWTRGQGLECPRSYRPRASCTTMAYPCYKGLMMAEMSAPLLCGVRTRIAGIRARSNPETLADRRTPSRMATGTFRYFTMGFGAAMAGSAQHPRMR